MKKLFYFFCFQVIFSCNSISQQPCDTIQWKENSKISWADFKGKPDTSTIDAARTSSDFGYTSILFNDTLRIKTYSNLIKCTSWTKSKTLVLLLHEQIHFDITEMSRRLFFQKLLSTDFKGQNPMQIISEIYQEFVKFRLNLDDEYDKKTDHSRNIAAQDSWAKDIQNKLTYLKKFSRKQAILILRR
jgi:hypothetical protein